jgi:hypothetical protein
VTLDELMEGEPIDALALLADAPVEACLSEGARWTLLRILRRRLPIQTIVVVRRLVQMGLAPAKSIVGSATEEHVVALGDALDARDELAAQRAIEAWWPPLGGDDVSIPERLAKSLLHAFSAPA